MCRKREKMAGKTQEIAAAVDRLRRCGTALDVSRTGTSRERKRWMDAVL